MIGQSDKPNAWDLGLKMVSFSVVLRRRNWSAALRTTDQAVALIEEMTGEKLTPEEMEELRQVFDGLEQDSPNGTRH